MGNIYDRRIRKDDDGLLDRIWEDIGDGTSEETSRDDFRDLQKRISSAGKRRRNTVTALSAGAAAAALVLFLCLPPGKVFPGAGNDTPTDMLISMGVAVSDAQVSLRMDNDISLSLSDSASVTTSEEKETYIVSSPGIEVEVGNGRILKLEVPSGRQFHLTLSDGTSVWLNSESALEYPASFDGLGSRTVRLVGEAFFEVARDENCPFIVELEGNEKIEVLGTSFNVNSYPENECNVTTLLSGSISYLQEGSDNIILRPDQQIRTGRTGDSTEVVDVESDTAIDWKGRVITFENESLPVLARRLSRMYGIEIIVGSHLSDCTFTGRISYDKGVDFITRLLTETSGISCEVRDGRIILD